MKFLISGMILILGFISCEKHTQRLPEGTPQWLKDRIAQTEENIINDPTSSLRITAWLQYEFQNERYYENDISYSSYYPHLYNKHGQAPAGDSFAIEEYLITKCCRKLIWKGPDYH